MALSSFSHFINNVKISLLLYNIYLDCVVPNIPNKSYGFAFSLSVNKKVVTKMYAIKSKTISNCIKDVF